MSYSGKGATDTVYVRSAGGLWVPKLLGGTNGIATLDGDGKLTEAQLPEGIGGEVESRRPTYAVAPVFLYPLITGTEAALAPSQPNSGSAGTADMVRAGSFYQGGPSRSLLGEGCIYMLGAGSLTCTTAVEVGPTPSVSAWISVWALINATNVIAGCYTDSGTVWELGIDNNGKLYFACKVAGALCTTTVPSLPGLQTTGWDGHAAGHFDGSTVRAFANGHFTAENYATGSANYTGANLRYIIGNNAAGNRPFLGTIEEVAFESSPFYLPDWLPRVRRGQARFPAS